MHQAFWKSCTLVVSALLAAGTAWGAAADTAQRGVEQKFDSQLQASDLEAWMKQMSARPTNVGSPHDKENAEFMQQQFRAWGWDAQIETFDVLYPDAQAAQSRAGRADALHGDAARAADRRR